MNDDWLKEAVLAAWQDRVKGMTLHEIEEFIRQRIRQPAAVPDRLLPNEQARGPPPPPSPPASSVGPRDNVEREIVHVHIKNESPDPVSHAIKRDRSVTPDHRAKSVRRILPESDSDEVRCLSDDEVAKWRQKAAKRARPSIDQPASGVADGANTIPNQHVSDLMESSTDTDEPEHPAAHPWAHVDPNANELGPNLPAPHSAAAANADPAMPQFDAAGSLVRHASEPRWAGRPLTPSARSDWLDAVGMAWVAKTADHFDWESDQRLQPASFYFAVFKDAQYISFGSMIAVFESMDKVASFCESKAALLRETSEAFRDNVRLFASEKQKNKGTESGVPSTNSISTIVGSQTADGPSSGTINEETLNVGPDANEPTGNVQDANIGDDDEEQDMDIISIDDDADEAGDANEADEANDCEYTPSPRSRGRVLRAVSNKDKRDWSGIESRATLRFDLIVQTVKSLESGGQGWSRRLLAEIIVGQGVGNEIPFELKLNATQLFTEAYILMSFVETRYEQFALELPNWADNHQLVSQTCKERTRKRTERLEATMRPARGDDTTLSRIKISKISWINLTLVKADDKAHHVIVQVMLALGFVDPSSTWQYRNSHTIRNVATHGRYTSIFKLGDGAKVLANIAIGMFDTGGNHDQQAAVFASKTWASIKVCLPILIDALFLYNDGPRQGFRQDPEYPELTKLIDKIRSKCTETAIDQMPTFAMASQRLSEL